MQHKEFQAVILAGGNGVRLMPLTEELPKALLPVANRPLIFYPLKYLISQGLRDILIIVTHKTHQQISAYLDDSAAEWKGCHLSLESVDEDLDSLGALRHVFAEENTRSAAAVAAARNADQLIVLSVDTICDIPLNEILSQHRKTDASLTIVLKEERSGLVQDENALLYAGRISDAHRDVASAAMAAAEGNAPASASSLAVSGAAAGGAAGKKQGAGSGEKSKKSDESADDESKGGESDKTKIYEYIAIEPKSNRLAYYATSGEDDKLRLSRGFLRRFPCVSWTSHLLDAHFYIMNRWVLDLVTYEQRNSVKNGTAADAEGRVNMEPTSPVSALNRVSSTASAIDSLSDELFGSDAEAAAAAAVGKIDESRFPLIVSKFTSIKHELIPYLISRQLTRLDFDRRDREFPRKALLEASHNGQRIAHHYSSTEIPNTINHNSNPRQLDLIKCFAYVAPHKSERTMPHLLNEKLPRSLLYCRRCQTVQDYVDINRAVAQGDIPLYEVDRAVVGAGGAVSVSAAVRVTSPIQASSQQLSALSEPKGRARSASNVSAAAAPAVSTTGIPADQAVAIEYRANIGPNCVVGRSLHVLGERVTLKKSNIGNHVKIGKNSKISNSIVMDHVTIGENCNIQNSIVCGNSKIQQDTVLDACKVGPAFELESGQYKGEVLCRESSADEF